MALLIVAYMAKHLNEVAGAPTEPDPKEWVEKRSKDLSLENLSKCKDFLEDAGIWLAALSHWTRLEVVKEVNWDEDTKANEIKSLENAWLEKNTLKNANISQDELRKELHIRAACSYWYRQHWEHRVDSLYLQKKKEIDRASCRLLRISDKDFATELYHRVKAKETSFEDAARMYGEGPEHLQGGLIPMQSMSKMPFGLAPLLERLKAGEVSTPLKLGKGFCMVELLKFTPSQLDDGTVDMLLREQFKLWITAVVEVLDADLCLVMN